MACVTTERLPQEETEHHLTTRQAAVRLRVSKKMVIDLVSLGKLPGRKIGARWLIPAAALRLYNRTATVRHRVSRG
jgi:excisionase family DNA binding protein